MILPLSTKIYRYQLDSYDDIVYTILPTGKVIVYVPFSATTLDVSATNVEIDDYGKKWCTPKEIQRYAYDDTIYLFVFQFDRYYKYDNMQESTRTATVTVQITTDKRKQVYDFSFTLTQQGCRKDISEVNGDIVFWKFNDSGLTQYKIKTEDGWSGAMFGAKEIKVNNINESKMYVVHCVDMHGFYSGQSEMSKFTTVDCDFSRVTRFDSMFAGCKSLTSIKISDWDFSSATNIGYMFSGCELLEEVIFPDGCLGGCIKMERLFDGCEKMAHIDMTGVDTSNVVNMQYMFANNISLENLDIANFNTTSCTDMSGMFANCVSLKKLDLKGWDMSQCTKFFNMFLGCEKLESIVGDDESLCALSVMNGAKHSIDISDAKLLNTASILAIFNGVGAIDDGSVVSLRLNSEQYERVKLFEQIITNKNWTIQIK